MVSSYEMADRRIKKMKKVANILFLVAGILSIVLTVTWISLSVMFFVFGSGAFKELIIKGLEEGWAHTDFPGTPEEAAFAIQIMFISMGASFLFAGILSGINIFFSFRGRNNDKKSIFICNIIFGIMSGNDVNVVAAIFGLIKKDTIVEAENN